MDYYFVLNGLLNGEEGERAVPAGGGSDPVQLDGWYYLRPKEADGVGPFRSRADAVKASESEKRYFAIPNGYPTDYDADIDEVAEDGDSEGDDNVVVVYPPDGRGVRRIACACFYDEHGVFELHTNVPLDQALHVMRAALAAEGELESGHGVKVVRSGRLSTKAK